MAMAKLQSALREIPNFRKIHQDMLAKATPDTGLWLFRGEKWGLWLEPDGDIKILWGSGMPGAGKTVLAALVIAMLEALAEKSDLKICVAYVYIRYSDAAEMAIRNVLEVFVKQTVERHPDHLPMVKEVYDRHIDEGTQPSEQQLLSLLQKLTDCVTTAYVIDALDEAPTAIQLDLVQKLASLKCKIFITSRPLRAIEAQLPSAHCFQIFAQDEDIDLLINHKLERNVVLRELLGSEGSTLREELVTGIKLKSGGMFLHASLQLDALGFCLSAQDVRETLEQFPSEIEDVYIQTWNRILGQHPRHISQARALLLWVLSAQRSMTIEELQRALATSPDTHTFEPGRMVPEAALFGLCRGLVTLEEESRLVRLVHYTARAPLEKLILDSFPNRHSLLAAVCMTRLTDCGFQNTNLDSEEALQRALNNDPLLNYAHSAWAFHAHLSLDVEVTAGQLATFLSNCQRFPDLIQNEFDILSPLHLAVLHKFPLDITGLLTDGHLVSVTDMGRHTPIGLACLEGYEAGVRAILSLPGATVYANMQGPRGWTALMCTASRGYTNIAELLLHALPEGAINLETRFGESALALAASKGHKGIVELLLARPEIQVNPTNSSAWSALKQAVTYGHGDIVKLILPHSGLPDSTDWSPLIFAATIGHEDIVEFLLSLPEIDVNVVDEIGWTALMNAALRGRIRSMMLLLRHPDVNINIASPEGQTALILAAERGHTEVVKLLLATPRIEINRIDGGGYSAIERAAIFQHTYIVAALLDAPGIDATGVAFDALVAVLIKMWKEMVITDPPTPEP
ncbi:ankyrin repeat-containing domain protein [Coprinopsis sp. MPI-PUGE-AT-0042]|nr:ankyrin repeat-containing domain protein [Coprinopsis sp. MPI-PUGE-AT-0042]